VVLLFWGSVGLGEAAEEKRGRLGGIRVHRSGAREGTRVAVG